MNRNSYYRNSFLEVDLDNLLHNINHVKTTCSNDKFLYIVVKGNGYGHGLLHVSYIVNKSLADGLAVATLDEAMAIRKHFSDIKILVLGLINVEDYIIASTNNITITIANDFMVKHLIDYDNNKQLDVHLKVNTGMNRIGFTDIESLKKSISFIKTKFNINLEGIYTHFATSESIDETYYNQQISSFKEVLSKINYPFQQIHCTNSGSLLKSHNDLDFTNANRVGIAIYGGLEHYITNNYNLKPTIKLKAIVSQVSSYPKGTAIGYSNNYYTSKEEVIATIPLGYADGIFRALTNTQVRCHDELGLIVGNICMDQTMLSFKSDICIGDCITLIDDTPELSLTTRARQLNTITHEILTSFSSRLVRLYYSNNEIVDIQNDLISNKYNLF